MPGSELVQALLRGLDILQVVGNAGDGIRLNDVALAMDLNVTTTHNLVRTLSARGFLAKHGSQLVLGPAVPELGERFQSSSLLRAAEAGMRRLAAALPEAIVTLARPSGAEIAVVRRLSPDQPGLLQRPTGKTFNLYANASGLVCLAFLDDEILDPIVTRYPFVEWGGHLWQTRKRLDEFLAAARVDAYAALPFADHGRLRVAAPIFGAGGELTACLGICLQTGDQTALRKKAIDALLHTTHEISA